MVLKYIFENYFAFRNSSTFSGIMILSTNMYAPDFGDFTILIALVNLFEPVCKVATDFFAMTYVILFLYEQSLF